MYFLNGNEFVINLNTIEIKFLAQITCDVIITNIMNII